MARGPRRCLAPVWPAAAPNNLLVVKRFGSRVLAVRSAPVVLSALVLVLSASVVAGCGGGDDDAGGTGSSVPMGLSSTIDGNATCTDRVTPGPTGKLPAGRVVVSVDELTFAMQPTDAGEQIASGPRKGLYAWKTGVQLNSERNALLELNRDQIVDARLLFDPLDENAAFDGVASTVRFQACQETDLSGSDEKLAPVTGWEGEILTKQPELCLRGYLFSERSSKATAIAIPLGKDC